MDSFNFSENIVTIGDWYKFFHDDEKAEIQIKILVISADSPTNYLIGPFNKLDRIVITSIDFNDGRIFSLGRFIRFLGYTGKLTVVGDVLPDQYPSLLACGFDSVLVLDGFAPHKTINLDRAITLFNHADTGTRDPKIPAGSPGPTVRLSRG